MARFYSNYPGSDLAFEAARFVAQQAGTKLADAVLLLPTRRAATAMRDAFRRLNEGKTVLLPSMISLADIGDELLGLLEDGLLVLETIPPPMGRAQRRYLLAAQVLKFEEARGGRATIQHALALADYLAELQDRITRAGIALTPQTLQQLFPGDYATHWRQALSFLNILAEQWPAIEEAYGQITPADYETKLLHALADAWRKSPPSYPVFAIGSTASQTATANLLSAVANLASGAVILPGLDPRITYDAWAGVHESHPYFHLKHLLDAHGMGPAEVSPLGAAPKHCSIWLEALGRVESMAQWQKKEFDPATWSHLKLLACAHTEEEARAITLLMREGLEHPAARIALITPDESLMARVGAHLIQYGLIANRLKQGTLADSQAGQVLVALLELIAAPESVRALLQLLRQPLVNLGDEGTTWLDQFEREVRGIATHEVGQVPAVPAPLRNTDSYRTLQKLVRSIGDLSRAQLTPSQWVQCCNDLLTQLQRQAGQGHESVQEALEQCANADTLGRIDSSGFISLVGDALEASWRGPQFSAHPQLYMLTPVEARLQHFDRVILGNMTDRLWPGLNGQSPWLNLAQQNELGLPGAAEHATLMAHDVLMLGSCGEVFLTYPEREAGSPVARSRFVERLVTLLATQEIEEKTIHADHYRALANKRHGSDEFAPEEAPRPTPTQRPQALPVSLLDALFTDPYKIYARAILALRPLDELDAEPEPRDFGSIAHKAVKQLSDYWQQHGSGPDNAEFDAVTEAALADFAARPSVQLFWSRRLRNALGFVNAQETLRREDPIQVRSEVEIEEKISADLILQGRIDRLEEGAAGLVIADYKTGKPPSEKDMREGKAVQLLAYAMLLAEQGRMPHKLEYWGLPAGKRAGEIIEFDWNEEMAEQITTRLRAALAELMDPSTPLLARPLPTKDRFDNDYDGISRYDEWAG